jgi:DNA polymerase-1
MLFASNPYPVTTIENAKHILIVDCANLAHRYWFAKAFADLTNTQGKRSGHVYGFVKALVSHIRRLHSPLAMVFALEGGRQKRQDIYPEYKGTRDKEHTGDPMPDVTSVVNALPGYVVRIEGWEADDAIASAVSKVRREEKLSKRDPRTIHILSGDRDMWQLVNKHTLCWITAEEHVSKLLVKKNLGVWPRNVVLYKALFGDHSDNIRGVPSIPRELVSKVIVSAGGSWERFQELAPKSLPPKLVENILKNSSVVVRNIELVRLRRYKVDMIQTQTSHSRLRSLLVDKYGCLSLQEDIRRMFRDG